MIHCKKGIAFRLSFKNKVSFIFFSVNKVSTAPLETLVRTQALLITCIILLVLGCQLTCFNPLVARLVAMPLVASAMVNFFFCADKQRGNKNAIRTNFCFNSIEYKCKISLQIKAIKLLKQGNEQGGIQ